MDTTPRLVLDLDVVGGTYREFAHAFRSAAVHYAMKCNDHPGILRKIHSMGGRFEIASYNELRKLVQIGVAPSEVLFSNPVKSVQDISQAARKGVKHFAFDSETELTKLAGYASGRSVYARLATSAAGGAVGSEGKFGVDPDHVVWLMRRAYEVGLRPDGVAFHVGSQMTDPNAWRAPIREVGDIARRLLPYGIRLHMLDVGGGFPAQYEGPPIPSVQAFSDVIMDEVRALPYSMHVALEPGRAMVAKAGKLYASVIGIAERHGVMWAHLDVGAFNGMMESLESGTQLAFPIRDSRMGDNTPLRRYNVTGPTCDSQDTIRFGVPLSRDLQTGDIVAIDCAGAYTISYAAEFNGFVIPVVECIERSRFGVNGYKPLDQADLLMGELGIRLRTAAPPH